MSAEPPPSGLRLLATLIAADLQAGSPALAERVVEQPEGAPRRGRRPARIVAILALRPTVRAA